MVSSSQRFYECSAECLDGFDTFAETVKTDWNGKEGSAKSVV